MSDLRRCRGKGAQERKTERLQGPFKRTHCLCQVVCGRVSSQQLNIASQTRKCSTDTYTHMDVVVAHVAGCVVGLDGSTLFPLSRRKDPTAPRPPGSRSSPASPGHTQRLLLFYEGLDGRIRASGGLGDQPVKGGKQRTKERTMKWFTSGVSLMRVREEREDVVAAGSLMGEILLVPKLSLV